LSALDCLDYSGTIVTECELIDTLDDQVLRRRFHAVVEPCSMYEMLRAYRAAELPAAQLTATQPASSARLPLATKNTNVVEPEKKKLKVTIKATHKGAPNAAPASVSRPLGTARLSAYK
jgi:hypothetical protein